MPSDPLGKTVKQYFFGYNFVAHPRGVNEIVMEPSL